MSSLCFHCGEALPDGKRILADLGQVREPVCCIGCKTVAEFIHSSGFDAFYQHRSEPNQELGLRVEATEWDLYDDEELLQRYVHRDEDFAEATIDIGGMYCSACVWLLDNALKQIAGVNTLSVSPATRRAVVRWDASRLRFSQLLSAIARVGFKPAPISGGVGDKSDTGEQQIALRRLIVAAAAGMQVMMFAVALYAGDYYGIEADIAQFLRITSLIVCVPVVLYSARPFFVGAMRGIRARMPGMDLPVAIAIAAAFASSSWATLVDHGEIYFDSVAMFVLLLSTTRYLEMRARHRCGDYTAALAGLLPETITRIRDGEPEVVPTTRISLGDTVLIRPGDVIPADGRIASGDLSIDESMLTGEALPVYRKAGMEVYAGGINRSGNATLKVSLVGANTSLAELARLIERAKADRSPIAQLADRVASKFVLGVLGIAAVTGLVWFYLDAGRAFEIVLATLVVTCPCALALATPAALAATASRLARNGFLLVRSRVLDVLKGPATIVFDKTGTLTQGRPSISEVDILTEAVAGDAEYCLSLAAAIETASEHVLARAFAPHYRPGRFAVANTCIATGAGVEAVVDGVRYRLGSKNYVDPMSATHAGDDCRFDALTTVYLANSTTVLAHFRIADALRDDAADAVSQLQALGYGVVIASGDRPASVRAVAKKLGVSTWHAGLSPADKMALVNSLQAAGETVVMVGDGINDAPVLQAADASIAIDAGTALARASADAVALGKRLGSVVDAALAARKTHRIIRQNISWAIVYNLVAVPLAATGMLVPWMAALGMSLSSLVVVMNALRLQRSPSVVRRLATVPHQLTSAAEVTT